MTTASDYRCHTTSDHSPKVVEVELLVMVLQGVVLTPVVQEIVVADEEGFIWLHPLALSEAVVPLGTSQVRVLPALVDLHRREAARGD